MSNNKKGIAPVIATILLVALVLVLILIFFMWAKGFISEQVEKGGKPVEQACSDVMFDVDFSLSTTNNGGYLQIVNRGNVPINSVEIKFVMDNGDADLRVFNYSADTGGASARVFIPFDSGTEKMTIYPVIVGSVRDKKLNKAVTCLKDGKVLNL